MASEHSAQFDADFVDLSISFRLPSELDSVGSENQPDDVHALKMASLGAARGAMTAIALEVAIPVCLYLAWHYWHIWR